MTKSTDHLDPIEAELPLGPQLYHAVLAGLSYRGISLRALCRNLGFPNGHGRARNVCCGAENGPLARELRSALIKYSRAEKILAALQNDPLQDTPLDYSIGGRDPE